ncbi:carbohydrate ABC transporter permease [Frigidibacter sp. MR17.24]|uniref:carbohydrate ABC transporter permease n=1 Tax=Frigidibacter sp. MR17.24 TaxID=3127345 RepID=UPI003012AD73
MTDTPPAARRRARLGLGNDWAMGWLLCAPAILALLVLRVVPALIALVDSFRQASFFNPDEKIWVWFDNYVFLFTQSPTFLQSMKVTVTFVIVTVAVQTVAALLLALLFVQRGWAMSFWRTLVFIPITIPVAVSAVVWGTAMRGDGILNAALERLGIAAQPFLASPDQALWSVVLTASWIGVGYWMVFLIAGLKDIPEDVKEAAAMDGAGALRTFFSITLPLLRRPLAFVVVANTVANFLQFVPAAILTQGGPNYTTRFLMYEIYTQAYLQGDVSLANAQIVLVLIVMLAIVALQFRLLRSNT